MWFNTNSRWFIIWIVMLFLVAIACWIKNAYTNAIICAVFGAIGLRMYLKGRKK